MAALGGCPTDDHWDDVNKQLISIFDLMGKNYRFLKSQREHRRGAFSAVTCGISYGGGQQVRFHTTTWPLSSAYNYPLVSVSPTLRTPRTTKPS